MCDDVFDDDSGPEVGLPEENEWKRLQHARVSEGYLAGIEKGENEKLQTGFNSGYSSVITRAFRIAQLRGNINAYLGFNATGNEHLFSESVKDNLEDLLKQILSLESKIASRKKVSNDPGKPQEKEVKDTGKCEKTESCCGGECKNADAQSSELPEKMNPEDEVDAKIAAQEEQYQRIIVEAKLYVY